LDGIKKLFGVPYSKEKKENLFLTEQDADEKK
jgi:hypothetical protein